MVGILKVKGSSTEKILSTVVVVVLEGKEKRRSFFWEKREKEKSTFFRCMLSKRIHPDTHNSQFHLLFFLFLASRKSPLKNLRRSSSPP